jgi:hypothetical protein
VLQGGAQPNDAVETLADAHALLVAQPRLVEEGGEGGCVHCWQLARIVPPDLLRLAIFTTSVRARASEAQAVRSILGLLLEQVRRATISDRHVM